MNEQTYAKWLTDLGPLGLTFALVIAIGYLIRLVPWVANKYIPLLAPVIGGVLLPLIAPTGFIADNWKNPTVVLVIYGIIVGVVAWAAHALIISRIEELLSSKFPAVGKFFAATADKPNPPPVPVWLLLGALSFSLLASGCATNKYRVAYNALDTTDSAVTAAERVFARYQVREARALLVAEGNPNPSAVEIAERAATFQSVRQIEALDRDYRAAAGALIQAVSTAQALESAGGKALLDPVYQTKVVTAANAIIRAIAEITETQLKEVRP